MDDEEVPEGGDDEPIRLSVTVTAYSVPPAWENGFNLAPLLDPSLYPQPGQGPPRLPQIPRPLVDLAGGVQAATDALKNASQECKDLFGGQDPAKLLEKMKGKGLIRIGADYQRYNRSSNSNVTAQFPSGAAGITSNFKMPDGSIEKLVTFKTGGGFFNLTVRNVSPGGSVMNLPLSGFAGFGGLTPAQLRGVMVLHEVRHAAGVSTDDHNDDRKNLEFTKEVATKCFGGK